MWFIFERFILECSQHSAINTLRLVFKIMCFLYCSNGNVNGTNNNDVNQLMDYGAKDEGMPT